MSKYYLNPQIQALYEETLLEVAEEVTQATKDYVYRKLYRGRKPSEFYDRDGEDGGFLSTFVDAKEYSQLIDKTTYRRANRYYVRLLLRNYRELNYRRGSQGFFGTRTDFSGQRLTNNYSSSELDTLIDEGYSIPLSKRKHRKRIEGIYFKEFAQNYMEKRGLGLIKKELGAASRPKGKVLISVALPPIEISIE